MNAIRDVVIEVELRSELMSPAVFPRGADLEVNMNRSSGIRSWINSEEAHHAPSVAHLVAA